MAKTSVQQSSNPAKTQARDWVEQETTGCEFGDRRLDKRFARLVEDLWRNVGQPIPYACQDWANTKAAYRFLSNDKVNEADILSGHSSSTYFAQKSDPSDGNTRKIGRFSDFFVVARFVLA